MKIISHLILLLTLSFSALSLTGCLSGSGGGASEDTSAAPKSTEPTLADELRASPFDISSIAVMSVEENPKFLSPENIEVIYQAETIRPVDTKTTTIERTVSIGANTAGKFLLKLQNGNYGPFLAQNCNLQSDKNLKFQCQFDNLVETYEKSFTRMYSMNISVNGVKIGISKNLLDTTKSYLELPIQLNEADNLIKITYQGYPSSFTMLKIEKYPVAPMPPMALFTINRLTGTTATAFNVDAKDSFDSHISESDALAYEWNFGDNAPVENAAKQSAKTSHLYATAGEYLVSLKVTSKNNLTSTFSTTVLVRDPASAPVQTLKKPVGVLSFIVPDPNSSLFAQFSAQGSYDADGTISKYEWDFGDKSKFEGASVGHLYKKGGTYTVKLTLTDDSGLKTVIQRLVSVKEASEIVVGSSVFQKEYSGSIVNPTKYADTFSVDPKRIGALYKVTVLNADGLDHPVKACVGTSAEILQCKYDNLLQSSYIKLSRATSAYVTINGVRIADSTSINNKKYVYLTYAHLLKDNQIQVSVYGYPTAFVSVNIEVLDMGTEGAPPEISTNIAGNILTSMRTMNIKVYDTSSVYTSVNAKSDGVQGEIYVTSGIDDQEFELPLLEGTYSYIIRSMDAWGNTAQFEVPNVNADLTDPAFQLTYTTDVYSKVLPAKTKVVVDVSEPCKSVKINNVSFSASADKLHFTGYLSFPTEGNFILNAVATDLSGRVSPASNGQDVINVHFDPNPPRISYTEQPAYLSNTSTFQLPINVVDDNPVFVSVKVNGVEQFETTNTDFLAPIILTREGSNTVTFEAKDLAGNSSGILSLPITRDTKPAVLTFKTPINNAYVDGYELPITVVTNEVLSSASINGTPFDNLSGLTLSMVYYLPPGQDKLTFSAYDRAGNYSEKIITVKPLYSALNPELTSITIDDQLKKILVKGAVGATRPNLDVKISTGLFSNTTVKADSRGGFAALVNISASVEISVYDNFNKYRAVTTLYTSSAAETLIGGQVRDERDNPLPGASVNILGTSMVVRTNTNGVFSFSRAKFPTAMVSGNQELIVDGSTVSRSFTSGTRRYGKTNVKVNIGLAKNNILSTPVYLAPVYLDGSATRVSTSSGGAVQDIHAPGVVLDIPSGATSFPSGKSADLISVQTLPAARSTIPTPTNVTPKDIIALEPSGTTFSEPVKLTLPNSNNLPAGTDMIILLMNSKTGQWELGGAATVSENGNSVVTKDGQGIRHFSLAFATITAPIFKQIGAQDRPGADTFNGAMSTSISLPAVKSLDSDVSPSLSYKSSWAAPTAVITNLFDFPKTKVDVVPYYLAGVQEVAGSKTITHCWDVIDGWEECRSLDVDYYQQFAYDIYFSNLQASIQPDKVETSVQIGRVKSDTKTYSELPQRATMTYAMGLFKDDSATDYRANYFESGIYNFQADYKIYLNQIVVGTKTENSILTSIVNGDATHTFANTISPFEQKNPLVYPQSLTGQVFVQNYSRSPAGTGWRINGVQKIVNPNDSKIMIEEANGEISSYSLENTIDTVLDLSSLGADPDAGVALNSLPSVAFVKNNKIYEKVAGSSSSSREIASIPLVAGEITTFDNYNYTAPVDHPHEGCTRRDWGLGWNICVEYGTVHEYFNDPFSYCSADKFTYSLKSRPSQMIYSGGKIVGMDANYHSFFVGDGASYFSYSGNSNLDLNGTSDYSNNYYEKIDDHVNNFKSLCQSTGLSCSEPTNIRRDRPTGSNACGTYPNTSGNVIPVKGYFNTPSAIANGPTPNTVVVADSGNNSVHLLDVETGYILKEVIGTGQVADGYCPSGCDSTTFPLSHPRGVATDALGNIYVSSESGYIVKVSPTGTAWTIAGNNLNSNLAGADVALNMRLSNPYGLVVDNSNNYLYVADSGANRVLRIDLSTGYATTVAGNGAAGSGGDKGAALDANLNNPTLLGLDSDNNLFIVDSGNQKVRKVNFNSSSTGGTSFLATSKDHSKLLKTETGFIRSTRDGIISTFDLSGKQLTIADRAGRSSYFEYTSDSQLSAVHLADGQVLNYQYSSGKLSSILDSAGRTTVFNYDGSGFLNSVRFPDGKRKYFSYNNSGLLLTETNENGAMTKYEYNEFNRLAKVTNAENKAILLSDSASVNLLNDEASGGKSSAPKSIGTEEGQTNDSFVDANGNKTVLVKDLDGYIAMITDAKGNKTEIHRDADGRVTEIVKPDNSHLKMTYDPVFGDVIKTEDVANSIVEESRYDQYGNQIWKKDGKGQIFTKSYEPTTGLLLSENGPNNFNVTYTYNSKGQVLTKTVHGASQDLTWTNEYNSLGQLSKKIGPDGKYSIYSYNAAGLVVSAETTLATGVSKTFYTYNEMNRLVSVKTPNNEITNYEYLPTGELAKIVDPKGRETNFNYNAIGKLISKIESTGAVYQFSYDNNGNLLTETDPKAQVRSYSYNELNQMIQAQFPDDLVQNQYDINGEISLTKNNVSEVSFQRDSRKRVTLVSVVGSGPMLNYPGLEVGYAYDQNDNKVAMQTSLGTIAYGYDSLNRLTGLQNSWGGNYGYQYDSVGRLSSLSRGGTLRTDFAYASSNLSSIVHSSSGVTRSFAEYNYDGRNYPISKRNPAGTSSFNYDLNGQLVSVVGPMNESFTYDSLGNRISDQNGSYNYEQLSQRLVEDWQYLYSYDANGNLIQKMPKDQAKNAWVYYYSSKNQLVQVRQLEHPLGQVIRQVDYQYDVLGRRMQKSVWTKDFETDPKKTYSRKYVYDGDNVFAEYDGNNNLIAKYTHSPLMADDILEAEITSSGVSAGLAQSSGKFYYLKDALGTVTDIADDSGNIVQRYDYESFGKIRSIKRSDGVDITASPVVKTSYSFTGREWDEEAGIYYYRARYYDPSVGRFLQQDPHPGRVVNPSTVVNKYAYVMNSPFKWIDPSGMDTISDLFGDLLDAGHQAIAGIGASLDGLLKSKEFQKAVVITAAVFVGWVLGPLVTGGLGLTGGMATFGSVVFGAGFGGLVGGSGFASFGLGTFQEGFIYGAVAGGIGGLVFAVSGGMSPLGLANMVGDTLNIGTRAALSWGMNFGTLSAGLSLAGEVGYLYIGATTPVTCSSQEVYGAPGGQTDPCRGN